MCKDVLLRVHRKLRGVFMQSAQSLIDPSQPPGVLGGDRHEMFFGAAEGCQECPLQREEK